MRPINQGDTGQSNHEPQWSRQGPNSARDQDRPSRCRLRGLFPRRIEPRTRSSQTRVEGAEMAGTEWKVDKHLNTMTITFSTSPRVVIRWTADQVDDHLRKLGELRTKMKPPHPRNFALGQVVRGIANATWATETDTMLGNSILHIRDPRYGWLHFLFSKEDARELATLLQKQVDSPTCHTVRQLRQVLGAVA